MLIQPWEATFVRLARNSLQWDDKIQLPRRVVLNIPCVLIRHNRHAFSWFPLSVFAISNSQCGSTTGILMLRSDPSDLRKTLKFVVFVHSGVVRRRFPPSFSLQCCYPFSNPVGLAESTAFDIICDFYDFNKFLDCIISIANFHNSARGKICL